MTIPRIVATAVLVFVLLVALAATLDPWLAPALLHRRVAAFMGSAAPRPDHWLLGYAAVSAALATGYAWLHRRGATRARDAVLFGAFVGAIWLAPAALVLPGHIDAPARVPAAFLAQPVELALAGLLAWAISRWPSRRAQTAQRRLPG